MDKAAYIPSRKPKLTVEEQIEHLKSKGITFELCGEEKAECILAEQDHYFRLAAYRVLFPKRIGGKHDGEYAGLDFGHLVDLAGIDQELRGFLLPLTLDVESAAKTKLIKRITEDPTEDGYSVFADCLAYIGRVERSRRKGEILRLKNDAYLGPLVTHYPIEEMPAWVFLELSSFGAFTSFYLFCAERWNNSSMKSEHYLLRCVNSIRNAAAHSSAIINGFAPHEEVSYIRTPRDLALSLSALGFNKRARRSKLHNSRILQITTLAYTFDKFVSQKKRNGIIEHLDALKMRVNRNIEWYSGIPFLRSSFMFLTKVFDEWLR